MLIGRAQITSLIPHAGRMCLIDEVLDWDPRRIRCRVASHRDPVNPLRLNGELPALCGIEYAAQAMALHGRLAIQQHTAKAGYLASVRDVVAHVARLDLGEGDLLVDAQRLMGDELSAIYGFSLFAQGALLVEGRAAAVLAA